MVNQEVMSLQDYGSKVSVYHEGKNDLLSPAASKQKICQGGLPTRIKRKRDANCGHQERWSCENSDSDNYDVNYRGKIGIDDRYLQDLPDTKVQVSVQLYIY